MLCATLKAADTSSPCGNNAQAYEGIMSFSADVTHDLPHLRRYARALTGSQVRGDAYVRAALERLLRAPDECGGENTRVRLFRAFHLVWTGAHPAYGGDALDCYANRNHLVQRIGALGHLRREVLLLTSLEGFSAGETAEILGLSSSDVPQIVENAVVDLAAHQPASILIVEDEPIISLDLAGIVEGMGHSVSGIAVTRQEAADAAAESPPDLILADLQLRDGSSGLDAVNDIHTHEQVPVVYITAYSDRLVRTTRAEPVFLVTKPFAAHSIRAAVGQALLLAGDHKCARPGLSS
jgi:CheY-like chemotaxis protein/DNA-directed RNA polymerase specialized sigma24 family protein